jgi:hypothetical protein
MAASVGESMRISKTSKEEQKNMTPKKQSQLNHLVSLAEAGDVDCMFELGGLYWNGKEVRYDPEQALYWWTKAANAGNVLAMHNIGIIYHGEQTTKYYDPNLAGYWLHQAAIRGNKESERFLNKYYRYKERTQKWVRRV